MNGGPPESSEAAAARSDRRLSLANAACTAATAPLLKCATSSDMPSAMVSSQSAGIAPPYSAAVSAAQPTSEIWVYSRLTIFSDAQ